MAVKFVNLLEDSRHIVYHVPVRVMRLEFIQVTDVPDVVTDAVLFGISPIDLAGRNLLAKLDSLEHRAVAEATAPHVVNLAVAGIFIELVERVDQVGGVDVVAHLLTLVAENGVWFSRSGA